MSPDSKETKKFLGFLADELQGFTQTAAAKLISLPNERALIETLLMRAYNRGYQDCWVKNNTRTSDSVESED